MDRAFINERITVTKAQIVAYETAIDAIVAGNAQSYTLDTGQNRQTVTKLDLASLQNSLNSLYNRLATLEARLGRGGVTIGRPAF